MFCEWCGTQVTRYYTVTLPEDCCFFPVCQSCVDAGEERGGGTAFCHECFKVIPIRGAQEVITYWKPRWYRRRVKLTSWKCENGCS